MDASAGAVFRLPLRVYYEDTDAGGVVYYANYLKYFERARTEWLRARGFDQATLTAERNLLFAVRSIDVDYRRPARLDDRLAVSVERVAARGASIDFAQAVERGEGTTSTLLCSGRIRVAGIDAGTFRPCRIPADILEALT